LFHSSVLTRCSPCSYRCEFPLPLNTYRARLAFPRPTPLFFGFCLVCLQETTPPLFSLPSGKKRVWSCLPIPSGTHTFFGSIRFPPCVTFRAFAPLPFFGFFPFLFFFDGAGQGCFPPLRPREVLSRMILGSLHLFSEARFSPFFPPFDSSPPTNTDGDPLLFFFLHGASRSSFCLG